MSDASPMKTAVDHGNESRLADHILPVSATMVGVCVTVISVAQLIPVHGISKHADEILAIDGLFFLVSAILSYFSIRHPMSSSKFERIADITFLLALAIMVIVGFIISFELLVD